MCQVLPAAETFRPGSRVKYDKNFLNANSFYVHCSQPAMCHVVYISSDGGRKGEASQGYPPSVALVSSDELF